MHSIRPAATPTFAAILPCYNQYGNSATILTADGVCRYSAVSVRTWLRRLASERAIDLTALKRHTERLTGQRILHILPFADDLLLIPVKVRTPKVNRDNCTGYVNACCVDTVQSCADDPHKARIVLQSGSEIPTVWTALTVEKYLRAARLLAASSYTPHASAQPELLTISRKLVEVFHDILLLKAQKPL